MNAKAIRKRLLDWYRANRRDLPWRRTKDPYAIWISEIMLQQTRVAAVIPYYERFLAAFPTVDALAASKEDDVLRLWGGLGYYSRARNLRAAAQEAATLGGFPTRHEDILGLRGIGPYTAAAVASIAFDLPHAAVDGNVKRVVARLQGSVGNEASAAESLLDKSAPGDWNQAMMELGALICVPRKPLCATCLLSRLCAAKKAGTQTEIPPPKNRAATNYIERRIALARQDDKILLRDEGRVKGFWELPDIGPGFREGARVGRFRHAILDSLYVCEVFEARVGRAPSGCQWWPMNRLDEIPLSTAAKKALACLSRSGG